MLLKETFSDTSRQYFPITSFCHRLSRGSLYYPSLHHISVELEDGTTAERNPVQYAFDSNMFPSYSWKGYVNFSPEQVLSVVKLWL